MEGIFPGFDGPCKQWQDLKSLDEGQGAVLLVATPGRLQSHAPWWPHRREGGWGDGGARSGANAMWGDVGDLLRGRPTFGFTRVFGPKQGLVFAQRGFGRTPQESKQETRSERPFGGSERFCSLQVALSSRRPRVFGSHHWSPFGTQTSMVRFSVWDASSPHHRPDHRFCVSVDVKHHMTI